MPNACGHVHHTDYSVVMYVVIEASRGCSFNQSSSPTSILLRDPAHAELESHDM